MTDPNKVDQNLRNLEKTGSRSPSENLIRIRLYEIHGIYLWYKIPGPRSRTLILPENVIFESIRRKNILRNGDILLQVHDGVRCVPKENSDVFLKLLSVRSIAVPVPDTLSSKRIC